MDRQPYYVSVQARTVMAHRGDASYEYEVEANAEDLRKLQELFEELDYFDKQSLIKTTAMPGMAYHHDSENDGYDYYLNEIYGMLQRIGTEETKAHLRGFRPLSDENREENRMD